jgi:arylsulfatase A-like enzyme
MTSDFSRIDRRGFLAGAGALALLGPAARPVRAAGTRPNILYIHSHDTGRYIQPYGHAVPAPNLQKLAEEGVLFRQAFCAAPTCSPSRAALLTGQSAHSSGMVGLAHLGFRLNDYSQHLLHTLRKVDYQSALAGVQHIAADAGTIGYDRVLAVRSNRAADVAPVAVQFLTSAPKQPFYMEVGFMETHRQFPPPGARQDPRYCLPPAPLPDTPEIRADMAAFKASAAIMDEAVGQVLRALESGGLADNTLVISTTDHGIAFPGMKCNLTDHGMGVMLIVRGPGGFRGGKVCDSMVSHIDVFPTVCDLLEIERPAWLQGRSFLPLIRGEKNEINEAVFAEINYHVPYEPRRCARTQRWKYIRAFDDRRRPVLPNCDDGPSKTYWVEKGWANQMVETERLYDLVFDPIESRNLASDPSYQPALQEMRTRLDGWMHATRDPLLEGPVKAPPDALVGKVDAVSVEESLPAALRKR